MFSSITFVLLASLKHAHPQYTAMHSSCMDSGDSNSNPYACIASSLTYWSIFLNLIFKEKVELREMKENTFLQIKFLGFQRPTCTLFSWGTFPQDPFPVVKILHFIMGFHIYGLLHELRRIWFFLFFFLEVWLDSLGWPQIHNPLVLPSHWDKCTSVQCWNSHVLWDSHG